MTWNCWSSSKSSLKQHVRRTRIILPVLAWSWDPMSLQQSPHIERGTVKDCKVARCCERTWCEDTVRRCRWQLQEWRSRICPTIYLHLHVPLPDFSSTICRITYRNLQRLRCRQVIRLIENCATQSSRIIPTKPASTMTTRVASHAGSWYTGNGSRLSAELDGWLAQVPSEIEGSRLPIEGARIIIAP